MKLNHLDLQVADVPAAAAFFASHFGLKVRSNPGSAALVVLGDEEGFCLVLQRRKRDTDAYPEGFHIGFLVADTATVYTRHSQLTAAAVVCTDITTNNRGTLFFCTGPSGILIEVGCRTGTRFE